MLDRFSLSHPHFPIHSFKLPPSFRSTPIPLVDLLLQYLKNAMNTKSEKGNKKDEYDISIDIGSTLIVVLSETTREDRVMCSSLVGGIYTEMKKTTTGSTTSRTWRNKI